MKVPAVCVMTVTQMLFSPAEQRPGVFAQVSLNRLHNTNNSRSLTTESFWSA